MSLPLPSCICTLTPPFFSCRLPSHSFAFVALFSPVLVRVLVLDPIYSPLPLAHVACRLCTNTHANQYQLCFLSMSHTDKGRVYPLTHIQCINCFCLSAPRTLKKTKLGGWLAGWWFLVLRLVWSGLALVLVPSCPAFFLFTQSFHTSTLPASVLLSLCVWPRIPAFPLPLPCPHDPCYA